MGLCNELETWVRLKWLVISPGRWEPGAAWIKWLPGWLTNAISSTLRQKHRMGREGWRNRGLKGEKVRWAGGRGGRHSWQGKSIQGQARDEGYAGYVPSKEERGTEWGLLAFMKKYREIETTRWWGWKEGWGGWKERSQASLVSICSHRSRSYLWPHCRWQQHG